MKAHTGAASSVKAEGGDAIVDRLDAWGLTADSSLNNLPSQPIRRSPIGDEANLTATSRDNQGPSQQLIARPPRGRGCPDVRCKILHTSRSSNGIFCGMMDW